MLKLSFLPAACGLGALVLLALAGWLACRRGWQDQVFGALYLLVCRAEAEMTGTRRGRERKAAVLAAVHGWLPAWARLFVSEKDLSRLLEEAVALMKTSLKTAEERARARKPAPVPAPGTAESPAAAAAAAAAAVGAEKATPAPEVPHE